MDQQKTTTRKVISRNQDKETSKSEIKKGDSQETLIQKKRDSGIQMMEEEIKPSMMEMEHKELQMAYKDLMDKYVKLKEEKKESSSAILNHVTLDMIRADLKVVDSWLKSISKENLSTYMEDSSFIFIEPEPEFMVVRNLEQSSLSSFGMTYNCNCTSCISQKMEIFSKFKPKNTITHKKFMITRNADFEMTFNNLEFMYYNEKSSDGTKTIKLKHKTNDSLNINLKFEVKKEKKIINSNYDFGQRKVFNIQVREEMYSISVFSIVVAVSMRSMRNSRMVGMITGKLDIKGFTEDCFKELMNKLMGRNILIKNINSWHQLSMEEEAILLTNLGEEEVYIYLHNGEICNSLNHISNQPFDRSHKIKIKELSFPMSRFWYFFASGSMSEDSEEGVLITAEGHNSEDEKEETDDMGELPDQFFPNTKRWENKFAPKEENEYSKTFEMFQGKLDTDFAKSIMMDKMHNKGYSNTQLMEMLDTKLANVMWKSSNYDPHHLMLMSMNMRQFQSILYFSGSKKDIPDLVMNTPINTWVQMWGSMPRMFYERFKMEFSLNEENFQNKLEDFMDIVSEISDLNSLFMSMMFKQFKMRIFQIITMRMMGMEDENMDITDRHNNWVSLNSMDDRFKRAIYFGRFHIKDDIQQNDKNHIRRFQASSSTTDFLKSFTWVENFNLKLVKENSMHNSNTVEEMFHTMKNM